MPVTFDNKASDRTTGTSLSIALTAASGATLLMFYGAAAAQSVSSAAYNGVALTRLASTQGGGTEVWGLTSPAAGNNTLVVNVVGAAVGFGAIGVTYTNVKNVAPFGTAASATAGTVANVNLSISSTNTNLVVASFYVNFNSITVNNGTTRASETFGTTPRLVVADITGASSITLSATSGGTPSWGMLGIPLVFSATASLPSRRLLGAGY